jgi:hypothetical protein
MAQHMPRAMRGAHVRRSSGTSNAHATAIAARTRDYRRGTAMMETANFGEHASERKKCDNSLSFCLE